MDAGVAWRERVDALYELGGAYDSTGDPERAVTLSEYLPRYNRSMRRYALALMETPAS